MTLQERINQLSEAIALKIKAEVTRNNNQDVAISSLQGNVAGLINDALTAGTANTWSIDKIKSEIAQAIVNLINGSDASSDTLKELADQIVALVQADQGLVSALTSQSFTLAEKAQARANIDAYGSVEIGDPNYDLAGHFNAQF